MRMTPEQIAEYRRSKIKEALAAQDPAVYNLAEIRKLEARLKEMDAEAIGWIEAEQAVSGAMRSDVVQLEQQIVGLECELERRAVRMKHKLAASEKTVALLTRLVERIGLNFDAHAAVSGHAARRPRYIYNLVGQREYEAAMHDKEGKPETRESTGYGGAL